MKSDEKKESDTGRFAYEGIDRALHEKARLGIMTSLMTRPKGLLFGELRQLCSLTDGNLSRHLDVLRDEGLVEIWKGFEGRRPQTLVRLSNSGRARFVKYLQELEKVLQDAMAANQEAKKTKPSLPPGWVPA